MTLSIILSIIIVTLLVAVVVLSKNLMRSNAENKAIVVENATKEAMLLNLKSQLGEAQKNLAQIAPLTAENARLKEKIRIESEEKARLQAETESRFKLLANEIFDDKTKRFKELNETRLSEILVPLKEQITKFEAALQDNTKNDIKDRETLRVHIENLMKLNESIGKEAKDLTSALKGNSKVQGDWGEMILRDILENCGLQNGVHFTVQQTTDELGNRLVGEEGKAVRPDVVVKFPDEKFLVIDSKVSLVNYVDYCSEEDEQKRKQYLAKHIASVKRHIDELKGQKYQKVVANSADFIMMFIPNEGAYMLAMQHDNSLWNYAYDNHVVIISPTHLISVLKLVDQLWQHDKQTKNALKIAEETGKLYDKFAGFVTDMEAIDRGLNNTRKSYDDAMRKLSSGTGNILKRVKDIKELGAKTSKTISLRSDDE